MYKQAVTCMHALGNLSSVAMSYMEGKFNDVMRSDSTVSVYLVKSRRMQSSTYKFGYHEHPAEAGRFICIKIIDCKVEKFSLNKHPLMASSFFYTPLLVIRGTQM